MSSFQNWCLPYVSKLLGRGHVYHDVASPLLFKAVWRRLGIEVMSFWSFWCWNLVPFLPDRGFQLLKSLWLSLTYFLFNHAPNVLYRWKIWTVGRPIQHLDSSTMNECCCYSCSMGFCTEIHKALPEIDVIWRGAYGALNLYIPFSIPNAFQNMQAAHTVCTYAPPYHQRFWLLNWMLITRWMVSFLLSPEDTEPVISSKNVKFGLVWP